MVGSHHVCFGERLTPFFITKNTSFHSYRSTGVLFFLELHLAFVFRLDFCSDLVISLHQGVFRPLVYVGFHLKEWFQKDLNGVGKKVSCKKWYKKELV
jgi:hypothetical protein